MDTVLVLIASPDGPALTDDMIAAVTSLLKIQGETDWLAKDRAAQIPFSLPAEFDVNAAEQAARLTLNKTQVDVAFVPAENRRKKLLVADMDSTMIQQECIDELADVAGIGDRVAGITARAMAGELDFQDALRARLAMLEGLPEAAIAQVITKRLTFTPGGRTLVATMKKNGAFTALISGGFTHFTAYVSRTLGFDEHQANVLEIKDGKLTGKAIEPIMDKNQKRRTLAQLTMMNSLSFAQTMAVGDGANDLPMLQRASMGVALHAKPAVRAEAKYRINYADLTALLYLQGYREEEFVKPASGQHKLQITTS